MEGGRQSLREGDLHIEREKAPYTGRDVWSEDELRRALRADAFIQSDDPEIRKQAEEVTQGLADVDKARALSNWVLKSPTARCAGSIPAPGTTYNTTT